MKINNYWKAPIKPKKRHNKTYRGSLTKRRKDINEKRAITFLLVSLLFGATYAFVMTSNTFTISGAVAEESPKLVALANTQLVGDVLNFHSAYTTVGVEQQIRTIAKQYEFKWENYLVNLACCEGLLKTDTINDKGNYPVGSRDRGLYGINDYWHAEVSDEVAFDLRASTIWTINHINNGKQSEFICDKKIRGVYNFYLRCLN